MRNTVVTFCLALIFLLSSGASAAQTDYQKIIVPESGHPALSSAAGNIAKQLNLSQDAVQTGRKDQIPEKGQIVLTVFPLAEIQQKWMGKTQTVKYDGYAIAFQNGGALICGSRPRSLLYAAGDVHLWKDKTDGLYVREPAFAIRSMERHGSMLMPDYVAELGLNLLINRQDRASVCFQDTLPEVYKQLSSQDQVRMAQSARMHLESKNEALDACRETDVDYYVFLYGNNFQLWSNALYEAVLKAYPSVKGQPAAYSWEKAALCPSDPMTWKIIDAYLREYMAQTKADGLYVTFWDDYGIYCQCDRCKKNGLNKFSNQLYECVKQYHNTLSSLGKKLIVRTWSSGVPHWLRDEWVHAPGYDNFGGSGIELWGRVFKELPRDIVIQTKVYHADCQPAPRFSTLLGQTGGHPEIAEYQMTGQTTGRYYFPASTVSHTAWTMKKSHELIGSDGGVNLFLGGTRQTGYFLLDDLVNSINVYAWRELSWDVNADMDKVWMDWAVRVYGPKASPYMVKALKLSEDAVNQMFSTLGMGSSTNSDFAKTIDRRETLLMYNNRHFLPEYTKYLEPNKDTIQRVIQEKEDCLNKIEQMFKELEAAKPHLPEGQYRELQTRFDWLREFAIVTRYLEESLFRFRYLRYLNSMLTTDPEQMKYLAQAYDKVQEHSKMLFRYDPDQKFQCYDTNLGNLRTRPSLGSPIPLMKELYDQSKLFVDEIVGPDYLSMEWKR